MNSISSSCHSVDLIIEASPSPYRASSCWAGRPPWTVALAAADVDHRSAACGYVTEPDDVLRHAVRLPWPRLQAISRSWSSSQSVSRSHQSRSIASVTSVLMGPGSGRAPPYWISLLYRVWGPNGSLLRFLKCFGTSSLVGCLNMSGGIMGKTYLDREGMRSTSD